MQETVNLKNEILLPNHAQAEPVNGGVRISTLPKSHRFFHSEPFWRIRITGYTRSESTLNS